MEKKEGIELKDREKYSFDKMTFYVYPANINEYSINQIQQGAFKKALYDNENNIIKIEFNNGVNSIYRFENKKELYEKTVKIINYIYDVYNTKNK
jgi:V8-like Glu-specific endopeptidase